MEMHQVRYFLSMARLLNFTRAAEECNVTQPSLTRAIQKLEDEFGGPLFRRERSLTHLTDLGRLMLPHLERTFEAAQTAKELARGVGKAQVTPLSLGVAATIESETLDEVLVEVAKGLPGFELSITSGSSGDLLEQAMAGTLDLVIVEVPEDTPDRLETWPLFRHAYAMHTQMDHRLSQRNDARLADAASEIWIDLGSDGCSTLRQAAQGLFEPDIRHRADDLTQLRRMILAGMGSAFLPGARRDGRLSTVRFVDAEIVRQVALAAIAGRRRSVAADAFVRATRARGWQELASA
ncbi:MAG TPA: LysR family transcriptional regulator [Sphingomonas sp.]|jgi:DNA-binding transcriptional LysR family regulator|nr:LysR family transcriptional regulator [Sphingomonas sp.]